MSSQSPQRNRKPQTLLAQGPMQNGAIAPRDSTPSPSFRERQRAAKAHSMPIVPSVLANQSQQSSPTTSSTSSRRTPPPTSRISPVNGKMSSATHGRERSPELPMSPPPPMVHAHSQPILPHLVPLPPAGPQHTHSTPNVLAHHPRPIPRVPPPQFLTQYQMTDEKWQMTEELMAEIERADQQQAQGQFSHPAGTSGVAYAGGAVSVHIQHSTVPAAKDPAVERVRVGDRSSPKDQDSSGSQTTKWSVRDVNARESPKGRDRAQTVSTMQTTMDGSGRTSEYRGSPQYATPMASPGERTAAYTQYVPEGYQAGNTQGPSPPGMRKTSAGSGTASTDAAPTRLTPPATTKLATSHTPPLQSMGPRPPDRSLPVQEEPEEDVAHDYVEHEQDYEEHRHGSPTPSSDVYPEGHGQRYSAASHAEDDDDETLNEEADEHMQQSKSSEESEAGFTPRSPSTNLPERSPQFAVPSAPYAPQNIQYAQLNAEYQKTIRPKGRAGSTDQLGMRTFDPAMFGQTLNTLRGNAPDVPVSVQRHQSMPLALPSSQLQPQPQSQSQAEVPRQQSEQVRQYMPNVAEQQIPYARIPPAQTAHPDDVRSLFDDSTSSYIKAYLQSPDSRPGAPIPPTPHSQTAAPSPSPLISALQSDIEPRQIGSPYPYPFTHIRRSTGSTQQQAPSTNYDMNNPDVIREQIALQMQIYALNNGLAAPSESAFSPSSTPYPGPGYNPWAFMPMMHAPNGAGGSSMSMRSSPSHEPVHLPPPPPMRGRGLRRRDQNPSMRAPQGGPRPARRVKPPPRVESTQPRETSPEPSSGEETAGEDRFVDHYTGEGESEWGHGMENGHHDGNGNGNGNGNSSPATSPPAEEDDGEWVEEEEEGEEDDLLELEFHPSFISNTQKRRRRWMTRWDALTQAFQALDRETDATLLLLASPSHSTKLHALTSRSIRRDTSLLSSPKLSTIRSSFSHIASQRRAARSHRSSLVERLQISSRSASSLDGSANGEMREEDLRRALETALGSLGAMGKIYEQRETRWRDEMRQLSEDRDRVELLLRQTLGPSHRPMNGLDTGRGV